MFNWIFRNRKKEEAKPEEEAKPDAILSCAKYIIDNGEIESDDTASRSIPSVTLKDGNGNSLYISWYGSTERIHNVLINDRVVPEGYDGRILRMVKKRVRYLQKKHLEEMIESVKHQ